jgi:hypothetical protein
MHAETAVLQHFCSVLYHKCVPGVIILTKQEQIFPLKMWYKSSFPVSVARWHDYFDSGLPPCKAMCNQHQQFEERGIV